MTFAIQAVSTVGLQTIAGTVSTNGTAVMGSGTANFLALFSPGSWVQIASQWRQVTAVASNTSMTIASALSANVSSQTYQIGILQQSGTDTSLSGIASLAGTFGITTSPLGTRYAQYNKAGLPLVVTGTLNISPEREELHSRSCLGIHINTTMGAKLVVDGRITNNNQTTYSTRQWFVSDFAFTSFEFGAYDPRYACVFADNGATFEWYGGEINAPQPIVLNRASDTSQAKIIWREVRYNTQRNFAAFWMMIRAFSSDVDIDGLTFVNGGQYVWFKTPITVGGVKNLRFQHSAGIGISGGTDSNIYHEITEYSSFNPSQDFGLWQGKWFRARNSALGTGHIVLGGSPTSNVGNYGLVEFTKDVTFALYNDSGAVTTAKVWVPDRNSGIRANFSTNNYVTDRVYDLATTADATHSILLGVVVRQQGASSAQGTNDTGPNAKDRRSKYLDSRDIFDFATWDYLHTFVVAEKSLLGNGVLTIADKLFLDPYISETNQTTVAAYPIAANHSTKVITVSNSITLDQLYDWLKLDKGTNRAAPTYSTLVMSVSGTTLSVGSYRVNVTGGTLSVGSNFDGLSSTLTGSTGIALSNSAVSTAKATAATVDAGGVATASNLLATTSLGGLPTTGSISSGGSKGFGTASTLTPTGNISASATEFSGTLTISTTTARDFTLTDCTGSLSLSATGGGSVRVILKGTTPANLVTVGTGVTVVYERTISNSVAANMNIVARYGTTGNYTSLATQTGVASASYFVPTTAPLEFAAWSLGKLVFTRVIPASASADFVFDFTAEPDVDTTLNVASYLSNITVSRSGSVFTATFNADMVIPGIEYAKAVVHRLLGDEQALLALLPPGTSGLLDIEADEIQINQPNIKLVAGPGVSQTGRVYIDAYFNTAPATAIDPTYVLNPVRADSNQVQVLRAKPAIDAALLAAQVWANSTRTLTSDAAPTAVQIRQEIDANSTQMADIKALADALPTLTEMEASTKLAMEATSAAIKAKTDALVNGPTLEQIEGSTVLAKESTVATRASQDSVTAIPTNPLLTSDARLNNLDAPISSRSTLTAQDIPEGLTASEVWSAQSRTLTQTTGLTSEQAAQLAALPTLGEIEGTTVLAKAADLSGLATSAQVTGLATQASVDALADDVPTASETAAAVLGASVEVGATVAQSLRLANAVLAGKVSGAQTGVETFRDLADTTDVIVSTNDEAGNRTSVTKNLG